MSHVLHLALLLVSPAGQQPTCDATSDPQTCANAFLFPFNRAYQIAILVILGVIGAASIIGGLLSVGRGIAGVSLNLPRAVSGALFTIGSLFLLMVLGYVILSVFGSHGFLPNFTLPQLGG